MNTINNGKTKIAAIATMVGIVAVVPAMLGGLISLSDVNVLSSDCEQASAQQGVAGKFAGLFSSQEQDCDVLDLL